MRGYMWKWNNRGNAYDLVICSQEDGECIPADVVEVKAVKEKIIDKFRTKEDVKNGTYQFNKWYHEFYGYHFVPSVIKACLSVRHEINK